MKIRITAEDFAAFIYSISIIVSTINIFRDVILRDFGSFIFVLFSVFFYEKIITRRSFFRIFIAFGLSFFATFSIMYLIYNYSSINTVNGVAISHAKNAGVFSLDIEIKIRIFSSVLFSCVIWFFGASLSRLILRNKR